MIISLPYPPSVNRIWRQGKNRVFLSAAAAEYYRTTGWLLKGCQTFSIERLSITIGVHPPDRRKRDIDNILKVTLDTLQRCGIVSDDNQFDAIHLFRYHPLKDGRLSIVILVLDDNALQDNNIYF